MRIINGSQHHFAMMFNTNRNTVQGNTMSKIDSAINRVNDPFIIGILDDLAGFFTQDMMIGKIFANNFKNCFFRSMICLRN